MELAGNCKQDNEFTGRWKWQVIVNRVMKALVDGSGR
jgi:hypothetical protein